MARIIDEQHPPEVERRIRCMRCQRLIGYLPSEVQQEVRQDSGGAFTDSSIKCPDLGCGNKVTVAHAARRDDVLSRQDEVGLCPECQEPQRLCPAGIVCKNGHGY